MFCFLFFVTVFPNVIFDLWKNDKISALERWRAASSGYWLKGIKNIVYSCIFIVNVPPLKQNHFRWRCGSQWDFQEWDIYIYIFSPLHLSRENIAAVIIICGQCLNTERAKIQNHHRKISRYCAHLRKECWLLNSFSYIYTILYYIHALYSKCSIAFLLQRKEAQFAIQGSWQSYTKGYNSTT